MSLDKEIEDIKKLAGVTEAMMPITDPRAKQAVSAAANGVAYLIQHGEVPPVSMMTPDEKKAMQLLHSWLQRALAGGGPGSAGY